MKPRIVAVTNQKGGVGKTTTTINLGASLAAFEKKTLLVDIDPQSNCTSGLGIDPQRGTTYDILGGTKSAAESISTTDFPHLSMIGSTTALAGAEVELVGMVGREFRLRDALSAVEGFRFVLIDCPPSLGLLTINALAAADAVVIPIQCEYFALEGVSELMKTIEEVRRFLNPDLEIDGIVLTMADERTNLSQQVAAEVKSFFGDLVFETTVPRNVRLAEAPSFGRPIHSYDLRSSGAQAYLRVGQEYLARMEAKNGR